MRRFSGISPSQSRAEAKPSSRGSAGWSGQRLSSATTGLWRKASRLRRERAQPHCCERCPHPISFISDGIGRLCCAVTTCDRTVSPIPSRCTADARLRTDRRRGKSTSGSGTGHVRSLFLGCKHMISGADTSMHRCGSQRSNGQVGQRARSGARPVPRPRHHGHG